MLLWLRGSLKRKLAAIFSSIMILTVALVATFSFVQTSRTISQDAREFSRQILEQAKMNLARYYQDSEQVFSTIASSVEFRKWILTPPSDVYSLTFLLKDIERRYIDPYANYHPEILSIILYNEINGNEIIHRAGNPDSGAILVPDYTVRREPWLERIELNGELVRFVNKATRYADEFGRKKVIPVMTFAQKFQVDDQSGYLIMDLSLGPTQEILQAVMQSNKAMAMISDGDGHLLAFHDPYKIGEPLPDSIRNPIQGKQAGHFFESTSRSLVVFDTVPGSDWKMILQVPYDEVARSIFVVRDFTLLVAGVCLVIGLALVFLVSDSVTRRISQLRRTIRAAETGNFQKRVPESGVDEVTSLARSYNRLLERIEESIEQLAESRLVHQKAIVSALQSQINSHFLYNALESINAMANIAGHTEIRQTALALSKLLRYTSNFGQIMVTIEDEVNSLNDYVQILRNIYGNRVRCTIELPDELKDVQCLKALLQPIVENSVKHGFEATGEKLNIHIRFERTIDDYVRVTLEDDGPGFDPSILASIRSQLQNRRPEKEFGNLQQVGLLNLHDRLKMVYPDSRSGIHLPERAEGYGAVIQVVFPFRKGKEKEGVA